MGDMPWVIEINNKLNDMPDTSAESAQWKRRSIYRVSASLGDLNLTSLINKKAYKPQFVSIGPYHHGDENLRAMEEHKCRELLRFLKRSNKPLERFVDALAPVVQDLKGAYDQLTDPKWADDTEAFLKLMIMDGCFILELLRTCSVSHTFTYDSDDQKTDNDYATNDPIFSYHGRLYIVPYLKRDMLMLENQIPMLVLEKLDAVQKGNSLERSKDLTKEILKFFSQTSVKKLESFGKCLHILDLYRKSLLLAVHRRRRHHNIDRGHEGAITVSATELIEAGIRIERSKTRSLKDISFQGRVLKLPPIVVDDAFESVYLNLIAFERFHVGAGNEITSYIFLMDTIIYSARDVGLLHSRGIIHNALGSEEAVANLLNSLSKDITLDSNNSLEEVHKSVSYYFKRPWNKWRYNLTHNYFNNPWAIPSLVNAMCLFVLTIIQTVRA